MSLYDLKVEGSECGQNCIEDLFMLINLPISLLLIAHTILPVTWIYYV